MESVIHTPSNAAFTSSRLISAVAEVEVVTVRLVLGTGMIFRPFRYAESGSEQYETW